MRQQWIRLAAVLLSCGRPALALAAPPCASHVAGAPVAASLADGCAILQHCHGNGVCRDSSELFNALPAHLPCEANFTTAACLCKPAWRGARCTEPACPHDCNGRGKCVADGASLLKCDCDAGFGGAACDVAACPKGCSGRGRCGADGRTCECDAGWGGAACDERACSPSADCSGHGACVDGVCRCRGGAWQGAACELRACPADCSGRGECGDDGACRCRSGFGGVDCSELACPGGSGGGVPGGGVPGGVPGGGSLGGGSVPGGHPTECSGHGRCLGYGSPERMCKCDEGWGGDDCSARTCALGCGAHGACVDGRCYCEVGFDGERCEVSHCPKECSGNGACEGHACKCDDGWAGDDCSQRGCIGGCGERQFCLDGKCECLPGWTGLTLGCHLRACPDGCSEPHGRCHAGSCVCATGYEGEACERKACPSTFAIDDADADSHPGPGVPVVCAGHGSCGADGHCTCDEGYRGADCGQRACESDCSGHGHCGVDGVCSCHAGWFGSDCALPTCLHDCSGHGVCEAASAHWLAAKPGAAVAAAPAQSLCACEAGWRGIGCELRACPGSRSSDGGEACTGDGCAECSGHGVCGDDGVCQCAPPWSGDGCERYGCGPHGCGEHGRCLPTAVAGQWACGCADGWTGNDCSLATCAGGCGGAGWCRDGRCFCYPGSEPTAEGSCTPAGHGRHVSLECSLKCVEGCAEICADEQRRAAAKLPGVGGGAHGCEEACTHKCLQVCASG